mgnify:CR=1 FL=1
MKKYNIKPLWIVLSLFLLSSLSAVALLLYTFKIDSEVSASIIGGVFAVLAGVVVTNITQYQIRLRDIENAHRDKKVEIYHKFLKMAENTLQQADSNNKHAKKISEKDLLNGMNDFQTSIILWGSSNVLKAYKEFKQESQNGLNPLPSMDRLYRAIREDIGLSNSNLEPLDLIKMYLTDGDELEAKIQEANQERK